MAMGRCESPRCAFARGREAPGGVGRRLRASGGATRREAPRASAPGSDFDEACLRARS